MALTEKMKHFCRAYFSNGGNGIQTYLTAYDSNSPVSAGIEASRLLEKEDIQDYLASINKPLNDLVISKREPKRKIIQERIQACIDKDDDNSAARWMDIPNKMDSEYININRNIEDKTEVINLDTDKLKKLIG